MSPDRRPLRISTTAAGSARLKTDVVRVGGFACLNANSRCARLREISDQHGGNGGINMVARSIAPLMLGLMLSGCIQSTLAPAPEASMKPRDKRLLASAPYDTRTPIPEPFRRHIVDYHRHEAPGTIFIDQDNHFLYFVLSDGKAIRYGVTVGEEAQNWSGVAKIGDMREWPTWTPTAGEHQRLGNIPNFVSGGPHNPMGARALYLFADGKDTLYRIHGTNQPEYIGLSISSGCVRMTNEDVIDLYDRVKIGTPVVVRALGNGEPMAGFLQTIGLANAGVSARAP
jgi:lipoprotein-anchoring transpeptidase ErfK/SrfK